LFMFEVGAVVLRLFKENNLNIFILSFWTDILRYQISF